MNDDPASKYPGNNSGFAGKIAGKVARKLRARRNSAQGIWLGLQADLGVGPWDVLHGGLAKHLGTPFGRTSIGVSVVVFLIALAAQVMRLWAIPVSLMSSR